jgi:hypothetical protein
MLPAPMVKSSSKIHLPNWFTGRLFDRQHIMSHRYAGAQSKMWRRKQISLSTIPTTNLHGPTELALQFDRASDTWHVTLIENIFSLIHWDWAFPRELRLRPQLKQTNLWSPFDASRPQWVFAINPIAPGHETFCVYQTLRLIGSLARTRGSPRYKRPCNIDCKVEENGIEATAVDIEIAVEATVSGIG